MHGIASLYNFFTRTESTMPVFNMVSYFNFLVFELHESTSAWPTYAECLPQCRSYLHQCQATQSWDITWAYTPSTQSSAVSAASIVKIFYIFRPSWYISRKSSAVSKLLILHLLRLLDLPIQRTGIGFRTQHLKEMANRYELSWRSAGRWRNTVSVLSFFDDCY